ncbi:hypothetical protein WOLCODRAFT_73029 [Wolfiporia cocos MD-104 SS10]|uniref:Uncharacterized protein n=1 Tax=Wolfiporia cocos (strain MD-104) TaxID=742152 RepID=A0A2H3JJQ8_WOLCO|nr:hypothetical protein WOLCODRAFT_73029 [Wolfiporia cocos MD-104 SS10]
MSPTTRPVKNIKVKVPRHNSQRLGPAVTAQVETFAREDRIRVDVRQTAYDPSSALAQAIESASDWNSLLLNARAERGPQWDIGTQQFLVEEYSDLYYDPTPLLAYQKEGQSSTDNDETSKANAQTDKTPQDFPSTPKPPSHIQMHRTLSQSTPVHTPHHAQNPAQFFGGSAPPGMSSPRHPFTSPAQAGQGMGFNNMGMSPIPAPQFYGAGADSPMRMGNPAMAQMGGMGMNMPNMGMGMGMGMHADDMGMGMGMNSPDPRRRITRVMSGDGGFGGMHG